MPRRSDSRVLAAVLFTDIVNSSAMASSVGDARWKELIARHHGIVRRELKRFGGRELDTAGDGFFASFGEPAAAIRCACAASESVRELGIEIRAGVHFGECEQVGEKLGGIAVVVGARVMSLGGPGDVLVTATTSPLVAGAGFGFQDRGAHSLKGVEGEWHVLAVSEVDGEPRSKPTEPDEAERRLAQVQPSPPLSRRWLTSRPWAVGAGIALVLALVAASIPLLRSGDDVIHLGANSIGHINADGASLDFATALGQRPGASAIGFGSLWVAEPDRGVVARVDLAGGSVIDPGIRVGTSPAGVAIGDGSVWVTNAGDGTVSRIDPGTNEVSQTLSDVGSQPSGIAFGDGALWVADSVGAELLRVDPATDKSRSRRLAGQPAGVAFTPQGVWVSVAPAGIARVDPADLSVTLAYQAVGNGPTAVLSAFDSIWVANHLDGTVSRLQPSSGQVEATIPTSEGPNALGFAAGSLWVANEFGDSLTAIDPARNSVERTVAVGGAASSLAAEGDGLWLATGASATEHRGGTLSVSSPTKAPTSLDPAVVYSGIPWQILSITNDGLLAYKKIAGPDGNTLVPDLASALPSVSPDGLTYRFPLREGMRYSTGDPVRPEDFRHALERSASLNPGLASLFSAIAGVQACPKDPSTCDLSRSIVTDAGAVTFHLVRPDPDLPFKLALPPAFPVPVATPVKDQGLVPVPATGPYMIANAGVDGIELVRNPQFHEWAGAAQPDGFVAAISWRFEEGPANAFDRLSAGELDWMADASQANDLASLQAAHPAQVVLAPISSTIFLGMDVRKPPFNDKRVRQALNYAIDRGHMVDLLGGPTRLHLTCQILPPSFQGYEPFCPYTLQPDAGVWSAPDLHRAQALIADTGATGAKVTVWASDALAPSSFIVNPAGAMRYVVRVLNDLGLRARLKIVHDFSTYAGAIYAGEPQAYLFGWISDYPRAGDFIPSQFRCGVAANASGLCDESLDSAMEKAQRLQATDPAAANRAWIEIENGLLEDAIWAPLANPVSAYAFSARTQNIEVNPQLGVLLSRLWVQ
ncbi:MAG: ABC transporter substrate-binding protein [Actinomycetota bacterium]